jgi:hypothetical protein
LQANSPGVSIIQIINAAISTLGVSPQTLVGCANMPSRNLKNQFPLFPPKIAV